VASARGKVAEAGKGPRRPQKRSQRNRQRILAAAERLFAERGYSDTSIDAVAEAVGMHQPGIYYYYPNKQALYEEVVREAIVSLDDRIKELLVSSDPPEERLLASVTAWVDLLAERPTLAHLILHESAKTDSNAIARILPEMGARVQTLVAGAFRELGIDATPDDTFHYASVTTGAALFYVAAMQPLMPKRDEPEVKRSMERHKHLLLCSTRDLIRTMRDESAPRKRAGSG
jgi:AcrR family transcriptional regulator